MTAEWVAQWASESDPLLVWAVFIFGWLGLLQALLRLVSRVLGFAIGLLRAIDGPG
jgi:hypothetical protein